MYSYLLNRSTTGLGAGRLYLQRASLAQTGAESSQIVFYCMGRRYNRPIFGYGKMACV